MLLPLKYIYISKSFVFQSGANVKYSRVYGKPNTVEIEEMYEESVPYTFENHCNELILKLKQKGEKQVWLMFNVFVVLRHALKIYNFMVFSFH